MDSCHLIKNIPMGNLYYTKGISIMPERDEFHYDKEKVERIKPRIDDVSNVEEIFKALSDPTRLKIAYALTLTEELCVHDVAHIINATTATASHHLRLLKNMKLARHRKDGKIVFYALDDDHVRQLVYIAMVHAKEENGHE